MVFGERSFRRAFSKGQRIVAAVKGAFEVVCDGAHHLSNFDVGVQLKVLATVVLSIGYIVGQICPVGCIIYKVGVFLRCSCTLKRIVQHYVEGLRSVIVFAHACEDERMCTCRIDGDWERHIIAIQLGCVVGAQGESLTGDAFHDWREADDRGTSLPFVG